MIGWFHFHRWRGRRPASMGWFQGGRAHRWSNGWGISRILVQDLFDFFFEYKRQDNGQNQKKAEDSCDNLSCSLIVQASAFTSTFRLCSGLLEAIEFDRFFRNWNLVKFELVFEIAFVNHCCVVSVYGLQFTLIHLHVKGFLSRIMWL